MAKVLLVLIVVLVAAWALVGRNRRVRGSDDTAKPRAREAAEEMVACDHCGVHLPRGDAVTDGDRVYCSAAHRLAGPRPR